MPYAQAIDLEKDNNQYGLIGNEAGLNLASGDYTVEAWVKKESDSAYAGIVSKFRVADGIIQWALSFNDGGNYVQFELNDGSAKNVWGGILSDGTTYHVAATYNSSTQDLKIYVDGSLINTTASVGNPVTTNARVALGCNLDDQYGGAYKFDGVIQCARISNNVRYTSNFTPATQLFTADANTLGLWWCNGNLTDASGNGYDATFQGTGSETYVTGTLEGFSVSYLQAKKYW